MPSAQAPVFTSAMPSECAESGFMIRELIDHGWYQHRGIEQHAHQSVSFVDHPDSSTTSSPEARAAAHCRRSSDTSPEAA